SRHAECSLVEIENRLFFLPLGLVLLAQPDKRADSPGVEARTLRFGVNFLDIVGDRLLFFLKTLDALDQGAQLAGGDSLAGFGDFVGHRFFSAWGSPRLDCRRLRVRALRCLTAAPGSSRTGIAVAM